MIQVLNSFIADKIAAGEVIERPVSIVKELIENSIDAGAQTIYVEIKSGGKSYIRVTDNGCGIPENELKTAFLRHATSKISSIEDLENISSLGFRGEALASISAVSRITAVSRTEEEAVGTKLVMHGGVEISTEKVGSNIGTTIIVEDLFYNTPARRKFMATDAREASTIIELLEHYAVFYAGIKFALVNNGDTVFTTAGDSNYYNTITSIYPTHEYRNLIHIESEHVDGYISNPGTTKPSRRGQLLFVNGRLVDSPVIEKAIEAGYGNRIFSGFPIAILFINVGTATIDVNIHPSKKEIKFLNEEVIKNEIRDAISNALSSQPTTPSFKESVKVNEEIAIDYKAKSDNNISNFAPKEKPVEIKDYLNTISRDENESTEETDSDLGINTVPENVYNFAHEFDFKDLKFKGYIFNTYIIMQEGENIYIFDQHAAHERIFYEKFMRNYKMEKQVPQPIITPITLNVNPSVYSADRDWMDLVKKMGFDVADFGPNTFVVKGIPTYMTVLEAQNFIKDFIENIEEFDNNFKNQIIEDKLILKSCKSAVKANNNLSTLEINDLMHELEKCQNPYSCPHGRPTFIKVNKYQIEKSFNRK